MKPRIIVTSADTDDTFEWLSDGWFTIKQQHTQEAQDLFQKARRTIVTGKNVLDTIKKLEDAGFEVRRS